MYEHNYFAQQGWECPKCGRILSPSMLWCLWCCNKEDTVTTSGVIWTDEDIKDKLSSYTTWAKTVDCGWI